jgi:hypothetical protein
VRWAIARGGASDKRQRAKKVYQASDAVQARVKVVQARIR